MKRSESGQARLGPRVRPILLALALALAFVVLVALPAQAAGVRYESEPNNGFGRANYLPYGGTLHGRLDTYDAGEPAIDFFWLYRLWARGYLLSARVDGTEDQVQLRLCLYDNKRRLITCGDNSNGFTDEITLVTERRQKHYLSVTGVGCDTGNCVGRYTLTVKLAAPEWEPNDSYFGASRLDVGSGLAIFGSIDAHGQVPAYADEDFFRVKLRYSAANLPYVIRVESYVPGAIDPDICLYRRPDKVIACSQEIGPDELVYPRDGNRVFWVQVRTKCQAGDACRGEYLLTIAQ